MTWLFLWLLAGTAAIDLDYSQIPLTGFRNPCPGLDSCRTFPSPYNHTHLRTRNCECDDRCDLYRDCCIDAPVLNRPENRLRLTPPPPLFCMEVDDQEGVYAVRSCPLWYVGELKRGCENGDGGADPLLSAPVTSPDGITYWNRYCATCNEVDGGLAWPLRLDCPINATWKEVTFQDGTWGVRGQRCELSFQPPPGLTFRRRCRANQTSTCPRRRLSFQAKACAHYMSEVVDRDMTVFRNVHCALCNGRRAEDLLCAVPSDMGRRIKKPFSFALLLDVNANDGDLVGATGTGEECPAGFMFDPFFKRCREMSCAIPGFKLKKGKCVKSRI